LRLDRQPHPAPGRARASAFRRLWEMALPLLRPRPDDAAIRRYTYCIVPVWVLFAQLWVAPFYGFNVWILDVLEAFGFQNSWTLSGAVVTTAFTISLFFFAVSITVVGPRVRQIGARRLYVLGAMGALVAIMASGASVAGRSLAGLYLSWGVLYGLSEGCMFLAILTCTMGWFRQCGAAAHGAGWLGFCAGFWPALFSYAGPAAVRAVGVARTFHLCAIVLAMAAVWPVLFMCTPDEVSCAKPPPSSDKDLENREDAEDASSQGGRQGEGSTAATAAATSQPAAAPASSVQAPGTQQSQGVVPMTMRQFFLRPEFWALWFQIFLMSMPGFGIKFIISPMLVNVFNASQQVQATASFLFLACFGVARLVTGLVVGPCVSARRLARSFIAVQAFACAITGALLICAPQGGRDHARGGDAFAWVFVGLIACIGAMLAGTGVLIPVLSLDIGGPANLGLLSGLMYAGMGMAATLGPITSWMALAANGDGDSPAAVGVWFCGSAGLMAIAMLLDLATQHLARGAQ